MSFANRLFTDTHNPEKVSFADRLLFSDRMAYPDKARSYIDKPPLLDDQPPPQHDMQLRQFSDLYNVPYPMTTAEGKLGLSDSRQNLFLSQDVYSQNVLYQPKDVYSTSHEVYPSQGQYTAHEEEYQSQMQPFHSTSRQTSTSDSARSDEPRMLDNNLPPRLLYPDSTQPMSSSHVMALHGQPHAETSHSWPLRETHPHPFPNMNQYPTSAAFPPPRLSSCPNPSQNNNAAAAAAAARLTLAGSLDPTTGVFYRTPEHPRLRTAQACEKCRTRKAKCSGEHPSCKRCINRGLVCEYAKEGRVRGPNKPKAKQSNAQSNQAAGSSSPTQNGGVQQASKPPSEAHPRNELESRQISRGRAMSVTSGVGTTERYQSHHRDLSVPHETLGREPPPEPHASMHMRAPMPMQLPMSISLPMILHEQEKRFLGARNRMPVQTGDGSPNSMEGFQTPQLFASPSNIDSRRNSLSLGANRSERSRPPDLQLDASSNHYRLEHDRLLMIPTMAQHNQQQLTYGHETPSQFQQQHQVEREVLQNQPALSRLPQRAFGGPIGAYMHQDQPQTGGGLDATEEISVGKDILGGLTMQGQHSEGLFPIDEPALSIADAQMHAHDSLALSSSKGEVGMARISSPAVIGLMNSAFDHSPQSGMRGFNQSGYVASPTQGISPSAERGSPQGRIVGSPLSGIRGSPQDGIRPTPQSFHYSPLQAGYRSTPRTTFNSPQTAVSSSPQTGIYGSPNSSAHTHASPPTSVDGSPVSATGAGSSNSSITYPTQQNVKSDTISVHPRFVDAQVTEGYPASVVGNTHESCNHQYLGNSDGSYASVINDAWSGEHPVQFDARRDVENHEIQSRGNQVVIVAGGGDVKGGHTYRSLKFWK